MPESRPLLTVLTEALFQEFADFPAEGTDWELAIRHWAEGLDLSDPVNQKVRMMLSHNDGWVRLLASRVKRHLEQGIRP